MLMDYYIMKMLLFLLSIVDAVVVPIIPYESDSIRVFCFTDESSDVSFSPDKKCESSCGYYDGQNTCCKVWVVTEDTVVRCYQSGQRPITLDFEKIETHFLKCISEFFIYFSLIIIKH